jgi:DNA-binding MarR family transcriptional regulator
MREATESRMNGGSDHQAVVATAGAREREFDMYHAPGHLIRRAQQKNTELWSELVGSNLTNVQFAVLVALNRSPGVDQKTLGELVSLDTSSVADLCRRLVARGLVTRQRDPQDARRYVLYLTEAARASMYDATPSVEAVGEELLSKFTARERAEFIRLLRMLVGLEDE